MLSFLSFFFKGVGKYFNFSRRLLILSPSHSFFPIHCEQSYLRTEQGVVLQSSADVVSFEHQDIKEGGLHVSFLFNIKDFDSGSLAMSCHERLTA